MGHHWFREAVVYVGVGCHRFYCFFWIHADLCICLLSALMVWHTKELRIKASAGVSFNSKFNMYLSLSLYPNTSWSVSPTSHPWPFVQLHALGCCCLHCVYLLYLGISLHALHGWHPVYLGLRVNLHWLFSATAQAWLHFPGSMLE